MTVSQGATEWHRMAPNVTFDQIQLLCRPDVRTRKLSHRDMVLGMCARWPLLARTSMDHSWLHLTCLRPMADVQCYVRTHARARAPPAPTPRCRILWSCLVHLATPTPSTRPSPCERPRPSVYPCCTSTDDHSVSIHKLPATTEQLHE